MKKAILIFTSYIPAKTMAALRNDDTDVFYLLPNNLAEIIDDIKLNTTLEDKEIKEKLKPVFEWIKKTIKRDKKNSIIVMEQFPPKLNYYLYDFIKRNNYLLGEDIS